MHVRWKSGSKSCSLWRWTPQLSRKLCRRSYWLLSLRRPEHWPGLPADQYEIYEIGDTWAEIKEGFRGPIWWRERYDWAQPDAIRWAAVESGFGTPGSHVVWKMEPAERGGSTHHIVWDRHGRTLFGKLFMGLMSLTRGYFIRRSLQLGLDTIEAASRRDNPA